MEAEIINHGALLENMRQRILDLCNDNKINENIDKDKLLDLILGDIMSLNMILDNHDARLRLIERCLNVVKQTYFNINLSDS